MQLVNVTGRSAGDFDTAASRVESGRTTRPDRETDGQTDRLIASVTSAVVELHVIRETESSGHR